MSPQPAPTEASHPARLLLLAGTAEARQIAAALADDPSAPGVLASLAGATRAPAGLGVPTRVGGFGGREAFARFLRAEGIGAVLDATHPFAARISRRSAEVCAALGVPYLQVLRPGWTPGPGDRWHEIDDESQAASLVPPGARVFLATGRGTLERFSNLAGRTVFCRQIDPPTGPFPFPGGQFLVGRPPFSVAQERALFTRLGIDWLVVKNAGGTASRTKLDAARELGLPVAMLRRPAPPPGAARVADAEAALAWVRSLAP